MKVPLSWLREYVDITLPIPQLIERLTLAGLEVGGGQFVGVPTPDGLRMRTDANRPIWDRDKIVIAKVLEVKKHPNADRLTLVTLDYGPKEPKTVVTGAPSLKPGDQGQKVILALCGSVLFDGHAEEKKLVELKPKSLRGVMNDAMVCSAYELGTSDEHEGIIILEDDAPVGTPLADFMGDIVLEIDVLPNMARCLSMIGVAREVAALTGQQLRLPPHAMQATGEPLAGKIDIAIEDPGLCGRYAAALIKDVELHSAPGWMQRRLQAAGMRPIGNIVDITNYVMLEWGQPLHAFDYDKLVERASGKTPAITVRPARSGEILTTLDKVERKLTPENLLIADAAGPIALAGVMGGLETEVSANTKNILLESANFNFISIRRTARAMDLPSEASLRFSRGVHPEMVHPAAERAADLMRAHAGGTISRGLADKYPAPVPPQKVTLPLAEVERFLGIAIPAEEAARTLRALEFDVKPVSPSASTAGVRGEGAAVLEVTTPPHRLDIQHGPADLIEELARIHGYDRFPSTMLRDELPRQEANRPLEFEERVRDLLVNAGLQEVMTYSLTTPEREAPLIGPGADYVRLANPISTERVVMRHSVLAGVLEAAAANLRNRDALKLFEIGSIYLPRKGEKLPAEPGRLALAMTGPRSPASWASSAPGEPVDFFDLKGVVESLLGALHIAAVRHEPSRAGYLHPGKSAEVFAGKRSLGNFGQLHPGLGDNFNLGRREVFVGELDLGALLAAVPDRFQFAPIPAFPPALRDIAIVLDESLPAAQVLAEIRAGGGELLRDATLFDVYRGPNLPPGKKSLAYHLTYQADDRTLTDKEVAKAHDKIVSRLARTLQAELRA